jgi:hypothetical protein
MGRIVFSDEGLKLLGAPPYKFDEELSPEKAEILLDEPLGSDTFIAEIARQMDPEDKETFLNYCINQCSETIRRKCCILCARWAPLINKDNIWHLSDFDVIYDADISAWWAQRVIVTSTNIRFVETARGLFTFPEFQYIYGISIVDHLLDYSRERQLELMDVIRHIQADLIKRKVIVADSEGKQATREISVLEVQPMDTWRVPSGLTLLHVEDDH